ncbi:hypothetical protein SAMN05444004_110105 [Jannaschia faecimaris]|uniref:Uncharacterized protein n=1 Tax=Jannaschia faecimaris TaxID=1244108 RepID=A0A1H3S3H5_9RHOB|nr:hypothetical protein [Jannaschia faecimaris]SDZ32482.1 hypothetical protein SAMN05444004_110105 [Jannaschia faecimaris]
MRKIFSIIWFAVFLALVSIASFPAAAETNVGSNIDSRVVLAFKANDDAIEAMLPDGWRVITLPKGPLAGSNLLVAFIDRHLALDPENQPLEPYETRSVAILAHGVKPGEDGAHMFVLRVYETPPVASSYGNGVAASIGRVKTSVAPIGSARTHRETWRVDPETGGELSLILSYRSGRPSWSSAEARPYSAVDPDFHRIYRYDQLADLVMSVALERQLDGNIFVRSSIPELADIFDGNETLMAVLSIPFYVREVSLP